jgi:hypothetical protein
VTRGRTSLINILAAAHRAAEGDPVRQDRINTLWLRALRRELRRLGRPRTK